MKRLFKLFLLLSNVSVALAQSPVFNNNLNPVIFCNAETDKCWGPPQESWKWDCYMACAKQGSDFKDMKETNCNGNVKSAYDVMSNGKPLMIFWEGWDCGNCHAKGAEIGRFMSENKDKYNFWLAFGGIGGGAVCDKETNNKAVANWVKKYPGFENAFAFLDNDFTYIYGVHSLPHYSIINPKTKKFELVAHQNEGNNPWGRMVQAAQKLTQQLTGNLISSGVSSFSIYPNPATDKININLTSENNGLIKITCHDLLGRALNELVNEKTNYLNKLVDISHLDKGCYIIQTHIDNVLVDTRKISVE